MEKIKKIVWKSSECMGFALAFDGETGEPIHWLEPKEIEWMPSEYVGYMLAYDKETKDRFFDIQAMKFLQKDEYAIKKSSRDAFREKMEREEKYKNSNKTGFVQQKRGLQNPLGELRHSTLHYLMKLYPLFDYSGKPIQIDGKEANKTTIVDFLELKKTAGNDLMKELVSKEILKTIPGKGNTKYYTPTGKFVIKGKMEEKDTWTVKVFQEKLQEIIYNVEEEIKKHPERENLELFPLAILAAIIPFFHYQTFFLCKNYDEDIIKGQDIGITKIMKQNRNIIKHLPKTELWRLATGKSTKKMDKAQRKKLDIYFEILCNAGAINYWGGGRKKLVLINPDLVFVSPEIKDDGWYESISFLFDEVNSQKEEG